MVPPADTNPPFIFGTLGNKKIPDFWEFYRNKKAEYKRWFIFGICLCVFYPRFRHFVNGIFAVFYPPFAFGTIWGIFKCKN